MPQSLAERTRAAVREQPYLLATLRAGICNYAAAARYLDVEGEETAVATALRRFADELSPPETVEVDPRITMESGWGEVSVDGTESPRLTVGETAYAPDSGELTAILLEGEFPVEILAHVIQRLVARDISPVGAGRAQQTAVVLVERRRGPTALRIVEDALSAVPV